jgi:3-oxoacyl-[acyl-carrier protein] reductase
MLCSFLENREENPVRLENKVAIVTGSGGGIGEGYVRRLAAEGARVVVADINSEGARRVAKDIGDTALAVTVDVSDETSVASMVAETKDTFGGIDFLVNNAAIYGGMRAESLMQVPWDYYHHFMDVNLNGALRCTRACFSEIAERGGGAIVNQSSTAAWMAAGYYGIAKAAVSSLTICLAGELAPLNIRVNGIAPGPIDTSATRQMVPEQSRSDMLAHMMIKRMGSPEDLAGVLVFLLSEDARWVTGKTIPVDGGQVIHL